jgi:two-component system alkaline phosphatase synthesis response regulator PhoP
LDPGRRELLVDGALIELTPSEFELIRVLMENPGYAFTRNDLLDKALGLSYEGMGRTLDSHIKNLRQKIEPDPKNPTYIQTIYGVGYKITDETFP